MGPDDMSRFSRVSRRAVLKSTLVGGLTAITMACGNQDSEVFAGRVAETIPPTTTTTTTTSTTTPGDAASNAADANSGELIPLPDGALAAVLGEMAISFTYTQGIGGKNERPYIAVWIEDSAGDLLETVALYYEQSRRGRRWIDHLDRWFTVDARKVAAGGVDNSVTISSATRDPGAHVVAWDGTAAGAVVAAGDYFVCIESAREPGAPYSLIRERISLNGSLAETPLPDTGELSMASVQIHA